MKTATASQSRAPAAQESLRQAEPGRHRQQAFVCAQLLTSQATPLLNCRRRTPTISGIPTKLAKANPASLTTVWTPELSRSTRCTSGRLCRLRTCSGHHGNKTPATASCEQMISIKLPGTKSANELTWTFAEKFLDLRSARYRLGLHLPNAVDPDSG
uniref:Uncharacterized protein n=1 Tax=Macrostomum lignano TaxID=282301 RepID=A0A1I8FJN2_9PLAT